MENFEIHRVGSNILPSFVHPCTKRDLGCHGSTLCGQNLMKMEEISRRRHHPLSPPFERSSNRSVREREREREEQEKEAIFFDTLHRSNKDQDRGRVLERPLLWEFLSAGMVAMVSNRGNFSTRSIGSVVQIR